MKNIAIASCYYKYILCSACALNTNGSERDQKRYYTYYSTTLSDVQLESSPAKENQFEQHPPSTPVYLRPEALKPPTSLGGMRGEAQACAV